MLSWSNTVICTWRETEDWRGAWFAPCHTAHQERSPDKDPGFFAVSASHFKQFLPPQNLLVTFQIQQNVSSPQRFSQWPPEALLVAFVSVPTQDLQTLEKNSELSTRGRRLLQKIHELIVPLRVQAGNRNPDQMAVGIQMRGWEKGLRKLVKEVAAPGASIPKLEEQKWSRVSTPSEGWRLVRGSGVTQS